MLKNVIVLSDGSEISSGGTAGNAIQKCKITECVNSEEELTLGSVCSACLEASVLAPNGNLHISDGFSLYKEGDSGSRTLMGIFHPEKPVQSSANIYKITAYDNVSKLDKDLSAWLKGLTGWPYTLIAFARMVCEACGLTLSTSAIPNNNFPVRKFYKAGATGRQLMQWIGEVCCRFCRADAQGNIELAWYQPSGVTVRASGDRYYFAKSLSYEDYEVPPIDAVRLRLADSSSGALWPDSDASNPYIITGNPILASRVNSELLPYLDVIKNELAAMVRYHPCKVSLPACLDLRAGHTVQVVDRNGRSITTYIMKKTQDGQRDTLECTGSASRSNVTAPGSQTMAQIAQQAVDQQTQQDVFNRLTDGGKVQGLLLGEDGNVYLNVTYAVTGILQSKNGSTFYLDLEKGILNMDATELRISGKTVGEVAAGKVDGLTQQDIFNKLTNNGKIQGISVKDGKWYINGEVVATGILQSSDGKTWFDLDSGIFHCEGENSVIEVKGGKTELFNKAGTKLIELIPHETAGGQMNVFDQTGAITFGVFAYNQTPYLTCMNLDSGSIISAKVGFKKLSDGNTVLAVGSVS